jgi:hypothetical protein
MSRINTSVQWKSEEPAPEAILQREPGLQEEGMNVANVL